MQNCRTVDFRVHNTVTEIWIFPI